MKNPPFPVSRRTEMALVLTMPIWMFPAVWAATGGILFLLMHLAYVIFAILGFSVFLGLRYVVSHNSMQNAVTLPPCAMPQALPEETAIVVDYRGYQVSACPRCQSPLHLSVKTWYCGACSNYN